MYKRLELHNHTTESDGNLTCLDLIEYMESDQTDAFAITDHNTTSGHIKVKQLLEQGNFHTSCIYGMEYTTYYGHILCFNLAEYVPWDSINYHKPELLFQAVKEKGGIAGIAHPFSFGAPFARGCRFEMTVHDFTAVDFIEVFNNPEPLHEVNKRGLHWWEDLVLAGHQVAATCGMDLHGKWNLAGQYATFIEGSPEGSIDQELEDAIRSGNTWISKGPLLICKISKENSSITLTVHETQKPGYTLQKHIPYYVTLGTMHRTFQKEIYPDTPLTVTLEELFSPEIIIPKLYEHNTDIEHLICLAPVITISS